MSTYARGNLFIMDVFFHLRTLHIVMLITSVSKYISSHYITPKLPMSWKGMKIKIKKFCNHWFICYALNNCKNVYKTRNKKLKTEQEEPYKNSSRLIPSWSTFLFILCLTWIEIKSKSKISLPLQFSPEKPSKQLHL